MANDVLLKQLECSIENVTGRIGAVPSESFFCYVLLHTHADISMLPTLIRVMRFWVHAGLMSREDAIAQLKTWMTEFGELKYDTLSAACVRQLLGLNAVEEQSFILDCFDRGQIDEGLVDRDSCLGALQLGTRSSSSDEIDDLVKYFSGWNGYTSTSLSLDPESGDLKPIEKPSWRGNEAPKESDIRQWLTAIRLSNDRNYPREAVRCLSQHQHAPKTDAIEASVMFDKDIINPPTRPQNKRASQFDISQPVSSTIAKGADDRIPRNSPCPCSSGKKYKKCCLKVYRH